MSNECLRKGCVQIWVSPSFSMVPWLLHFFWLFSNCYVQNWVTTVLLIKKMYDNNRVRTLKHFCESTSLHGYNYLLNGESITQKVFWVIVITTMTAIGISLLIQNTGDFVDSRIITTIDSSSAPLDVSILIPSLLH